MNNYELMLILDPQITEDDRASFIKELKALFTKTKTNVVKEDIWGKKELAYKINNSSEGEYILYTIELDGKLILKFTKFFNLNNSVVWRHLFVKIEA